MAENYGKPVNVTGPDGQQMVAHRNSQGLVISENGTDIMTVGYGRDRSLGFAFSDGSNERVFIGRDSSGNIFFKFAQTGYDAKTATNSRLIMSSDFNSFKIAQTNTTNVSDFSTGSHSTATNSVTINYPADIITNPIVLAFTNSASGAYSFLWQGISPESVLSSPASSPIGYTVLIKYLTFLDSPSIGNITFQVSISNATGSSVGGAGSGYPIRYYILQETATTS